MSRITDTPRLAQAPNPVLGTNGANAGATAAATQPTPVAQNTYSSPARGLRQGGPGGSLDLGADISALEQAHPMFAKIMQDPNLQKMAQVFDRVLHGGNVRQVLDEILAGGDGGGTAQPTVGAPALPGRSAQRPA